MTVTGRAVVGSQVFDLSAPLTLPPPVSGWPDATNTGPTGTLATYTGPTTITTAGAVIQNVRVNGQLTVRAADVTIRNCQITVNPNQYFGVLTYAPRTRVVDTRIVGGLTCGVAAFTGGTVDVLRCDVSGGEDGVRLRDDSSCIDSYVHDLAGDDGSSHYDGVTADGFRRWVIRHNTILNHRTWTGCVWVGDPRYGGSEGILADNLLAGGGYSIYGGPGVGAGIRVTGNVFSRRYFPRCGYWGPVVYWQSAGNTWEGNTYDDGSPVQP